jgi:hypothetical protein
LRLSGARCAAKASRRRRPYDLAKERQPACRVGVDERRQEEPPEQAGKHPHRQKEARLAAYPVRPIERYPTARHNHMGVGMVGHGRAPAVEHGGSADASTKMLGIGRNREQRLGGCAERQVVDDRLVLVGDRSDLGRKRKDDVEIADRRIAATAASLSTRAAIAIAQSARARRRRIGSPPARPTCWALADRPVFKKRRQSHNAATFARKATLNAKNTQVLFTTTPIIARTLYPHCAVLIQLC